MTSWVILLIKQYIDIIKYLLIGDAIFDLNKDKKKRTRENIILSILILIVYIIFYNQIVDIWIDLNALICLIYLVIIYRGGILKTIKVTIIITLITTLLEQFIGSFISYDAINVYSHSFIVSNILRFIIVILISKSIQYILNKTDIFNNLPWYIFVNIIFGFSATMFPLFMVQTYKISIKSRLATVTTVIAYVNILISLVSIFLFIKNRNERDKYYIDNLMKDKTLKLQEEYYKRLIDNYSNIRKFKHDIKAHITVINKLIDIGNYNEANIYLKNMSETITSKDIYNTNNIYISTILNSFEQIFKNNQIQFNLSYYINGDIKMESMDICSLFYNLVLNSIEANYKIDNNRFIKLYIANIKNNVLIKIVNPVSNDFDISSIIKNKTTKSNKDNHGFGLVTINNIIYKYNGSIDYSIEDKILIIDITLLNVIN